MRQRKRESVAVTELLHGRVPGRWGSPVNVEVVLFVGGNRNITI